MNGSEGSKKNLPEVFPMLVGRFGVSMSVFRVFLRVFLSVMVPKKKLSKKKPLGGFSDVSRSFWGFHVGVLCGERQICG